MSGSSIIVWWLESSGKICSEIIDPAHLPNGVDAESEIRTKSAVNPIEIVSWEVERSKESYAVAALARLKVQSEKILKGN